MHASMITAVPKGIIGPRYKLGDENLSICDGSSARPGRGDRVIERLAGPLGQPPPQAPAGA